MTRATEASPTVRRGKARSMLQFDFWSDVLDHVRAGRPIYYAAPLDRTPHRVQALVNGPRSRTVRIAPIGHADAFDAFSADHAHLERFYRSEAKGGAS